MKPKERDIQNLIMHYLRVHGFYTMRLNSGKFSVGEGRSRRYVMGQEKGTPDILAHRVNDGLVELIYVEVKAGKNMPTLAQENKMAELERYGAKTIVAHSIEELEDQL